MRAGAGGGGGRHSGLAKNDGELSDLRFGEMGRIFNRLLICMLLYLCNESPSSLFQEGASPQLLRVPSAQCLEGLLSCRVTSPRVLTLMQGHQCGVRRSATPTHLGQLSGDRSGSGTPCGSCHWVCVAGSLLLCPALPSLPVHRCDPSASP